MNTKRSPEYKTLHGEFHAEFAPTAHEERFLVDCLVHSQWRQRQLLRLETAIWNAHRIEGGSEEENSMSAVCYRAAKALDRVGRAIDLADRSFLSALKQLLDIRAERTKTAAKAIAKQPAAPSSGLFAVPKRS